MKESENTQGQSSAIPSTDGLGEMLLDGVMFFHTQVGEAKQEDREYDLINDMTGAPIVRSIQTGKRFRITWQAILTLAIRAGIDSPNV